MNFLKRLVTEVFDPFELLYMSIAIATLDHTIWAAAFLFEGSMPDADAMWWKLKGLLIAIAVDLGMLITSRFLQSSTNKMQTFTLVLSFLVAAITSFYFQMVYILFHTPTFIVSSGVDKYWVDALLPLLNARVFILPLALPVLAIVFTTARIFRHKATHAEPKTLQQVAVVVSKKGEEMSDLARLIQLAEGAPDDISPEQGTVSLNQASMDLTNLTWFYAKTNRSYGPYKGRKQMIFGMKRVMGIVESGEKPDLDQPALLPTNEQ